MLLDHSLGYALARGLPGLLNFLAIAVYTRLLQPEGYGDYSLVVAAVALLDAVLIQWLRLGLLRFLPQTGGQTEDQLLRTLRNLWLRTATLVTVVTVLAVLLPVVQVPTGLLLSGLLLFLSQGLFELNLELVRSRLQPGQYGRLALLRAGLSLALGSLFAWHWGAAGLLTGLSLGTLLTFVLLRQHALWSQPGLAVDPELRGRLLRYGVPLTITFALGFVVNSSDRFLIGWLLGRAETGLYSAGYDLANFSITMLLTIINLAAYPLTVRALESEGVEAARRQLQNTLLLLLTIGLPATTGLVMLAEPFAATVTGGDFNATAAVVVPWIAFAALVAGIKAYFVDVGFQLGRDTRLQAWVMLVAAVLNVALNLLFIPRWGLMGAVWSTVLVWVIALLLSIVLVRRAFRLPGPRVVLLRPVLATAVMALTLWLLPLPGGLVQLLVTVLFAALVYAAATVLLTPQLRRRFLRL